jgi:hypothetical protein
LNPNDPLAQLRDIHLPAEVSWWPLAWGWWLLIALAGAALIGLIWMLLKRHQSRLYRRQAQAQIDRLQQQHTANLLPTIFAVLKQAANTAYPEQRFGSLGTNEFIAFLQQSCDQSIFDQLPDNLDSLLYANQSQIDQSLHKHLVTSASLWIARHPKQVPVIC